MEQPYLTGKRIIKFRKYNPNYGDIKLCKCGHTYYRHFDFFNEREEDQDVGCKYCGCWNFELEEEV